MSSPKGFHLTGLHGKNLGKSMRIIANSSLGNCNFINTCNSMKTTVFTVGRIAAVTGGKDYQTHRHEAFEFLEVESYNHEMVVLMSISLDSYFLTIIIH